MKRLGFIIIVLLLATITQAQDPLIEYGDPSELASIKTVYIYTGMDMKAREKIIKALKKYDKNKRLQIVDQMADADVKLVYARDSYSTGTYSQINRNIVTGEPIGVTTKTKGVRVGAGSAMTLDARRNVVRLLWQYSGGQGSRLQKSPETKFAKQFVQAVEDAKASQK